MIDEKLTNAEVTGGSVTTDVFPNSTRTYRYYRFAQRITEHGGLAVVRCGEPVISGAVSLGEHCYGIYKP